MRGRRRRYVAFSVTSPRPLGRKDVAGLIRSMLGEEAPSVTLIVYDFETRRGILRCDHRELEAVRGLLNSSVDDVAIATLKTSGTIRALRRGMPELSRSGKAP